MDEVIFCSLRGAWLTWLPLPLTYQHAWFRWVPSPIRLLDLYESQRLLLIRVPNLHESPRLIIFPLKKVLKMMAFEFNAYWLYAEKYVCLNFGTSISDSLNQILTCCWFLFVNFVFEIAPQKEIRPGTTPMDSSMYGNDDSLSVAGVMEAEVANECSRQV